MLRLGGVFLSILASAVILVLLSGLVLGVALGPFTARAARAVTVITGNGLPLFGGTLTPSRLPRAHPAPIGLQFALKAPQPTTSARITDLRIEFPPALTRDSDGLPTCDNNRIRDLSLERARETCSPALVGEGSFVPHLSGCFCAEVGVLLAFNSMSEGRPAILIAAAYPGPFPNRFSVVLRSANAASGGFTSAFTGTVPRFADRYGYLSALSLRLQRHFRVDGERRSYLSAMCPAPNGFNQVNFAFARLAFALDDGREFSSKLVRRCNVRNETSS